ncbi:MAG: beta-N-acetylhexosaminidase [Calditrichaeota bacterium]|nr:MAG: beta-N-acetylhexosaminidase [Calditrichota bacterium]MBL1204825.1 beta-N-acetylhexosaminidase [Calditrichota bacterium]NOG44654.1 family 20 glycosylhydrolase [Calditrichota bacterium]
MIILFQQSYTQHTIIPEPAIYEATENLFMLDTHFGISINTDDPKVAVYVKQFQKFLEMKGITIDFQGFKVQSKEPKALLINLTKNKIEEIGEEGYVLEVKQRFIVLSANKAAGIFNGFQTLRQLLPPEFENPDFKISKPINIKGCKIKDYPRFGWRGLLFDVSRHFFSVDDVKAFIDKMSQYKYNVLHWHLTDDEGWRIEIKSLPKLTEVGAWRVERHGRFGKERQYPKKGEKATYGGFYTHEQIKDVVKYAANRNITIVPEIDMPGHSMAALAAYPELSTKKEPKFVNPGSKFAEWFPGGGFRMLIENTLNPADEKVYDFVDKVFSEVAELFPGEYIHMGGDECDHYYWEQDSVVQHFMKKNNISDGKGLQGYFVSRVNKIIESKGKKMIGWDEILDGELNKDVAVMSWHGMVRGIEAAKLGHKVVMTPTTYCYLDYTQGDHSLENPIYANLSLEKSYNFEPLVPEEIDPKLILGGQGNLWTEAIPNLHFAFNMAYPRALSISENLWSPKDKKNWESFIIRTEEHFLRFDAANTNISKAVLDPIVNVYMQNDKLICELKNSIPGSEIFYTIDNTYPVKFGQKYSKPLEIPEGRITLRAQTFRNGKPLGRLLLIQRSELEKRADK